MNPGLEAVLVVLGAGTGSVLRYLISGWVGHKAGPKLPWGTLTVNSLGCLSLGLLTSLAADERNLVFVLSGGVIGGFTTFSTLMLETSNLALARQTPTALANICANLLLGFAALFLGTYLGGSL